MEDIGYTYSESVYGYVSDDISLTGDTMLYIALSEKGHILIKKKDRVTDKNPKVLISTESTEFEIKVSGRNKGQIISIITDTEPLSIQKENI